MTVEELSGVRKAAVLLVQLGKERSAKVLAQMREPEIEELTAEIVRLRSVGSDVVDEVVDEFHTLAQARAYVGSGGLEFAQALLEQSLGAERASAVLERLSATALNQPFRFLHEADPRQILSFLSGEHPQTMALVLAHLRADQSSIILSGLPSQLQAEVAHRIAVMDRTSPDVVRSVEDELQRKTSSVLTSGDLAEVGGVQPLVDIINRADRATERMILQGLESRDAKLAEAVRSRMFVFEDITTLEDKAIQLVLRQVETGDLATALKGVRDDVRDKVLGNVSERARENVLEEIELMGAVRLSQVEEAQAAVVRVIRTLEESGQIMVRRGGDDDFVA
jgi:flagellar motor switch protein FliG